MMAKTDRMFFFRLLRIQFITEISQFFQNHKQQSHSRWTAILLEYQAEDRACFCHDVTHGMLSFSFFVLKWIENWAELNYYFETRSLEC